MSNKNQIEIQNDKPISCKVIVVGDSGVGKTSIIKRYLNSFKENEKSTIGASYSTKSQIIGKYTISFDIWDTAGEERFRSVNSIFYKEACACILVYDITNVETFQNIKTYWYDSVKNNAISEIIFAVAGNKCDLYTKEKVKIKEAKEFCKEIDAIFFETSALENQSIDEIFEKLGEKFISSEIFKKIMSNLEYENKLELKRTKVKKKKVCC